MSGSEAVGTRAPTPVWTAALAAGAIASITYLVLEMLTLPLFTGASPWDLMRMVAALVWGPNVLPPPSTFDGTIVVSALLVHIALSLVYAVAFVIMFRGLPTPWIHVAGIIFGIALYLLNFHVFTAFFPWFVAARGILTLVLHAIFGLIVAWTYVAFSRLATRTYPRGSA